VQRPENANDTVSEGMAYGMLFAVYMNDKATFDALWKYEQKFLDPMGLMHWHINGDGTIAGRNSATARRSSAARRSSTAGALDRGSHHRDRLRRDLAPAGRRRARRRDRGDRLRPDPTRFERVSHDRARDVLDDCVCPRLE